VALRVLRKLADTFTGYNDPNAFVVYAGLEGFALDFESLSNGTPYFYHSYSYDGSAWTDGDPGGSSTATPAATNAETGPDPLSLVRDRLAVGLAAEVAAGNLSPQSGLIQVLTAPPLFESTSWPLVTVHLRSDAPEVRGIGELDVPDYFDPVTGSWNISEGWLAAVQLDIIGWVVANPDERIALRKAIKKILQGNLPVFDQAGMVLIQFSATDVEDFESYASPVYQTVYSFSCLAPSLTSAATTATVADVTVTAIAA
jgi:hypothetical protein